MKTSILKAIAFAAISFLVLAFCAWEINPARWGVIWRFIYAGIILYCILWVYIDHNYAANYEEIMARREKRKEEDAEIERRAGGFRALLQRQLDEAERARKANQNP